MSTPVRWSIEYELLLGRIERICHDLGQVDADLAATEQRLSELETQILTLGAFPAMPSVSDYLPDPATHRLGASPASLTPQTALVGHVIGRLETLSRAIGRNESETALIDGRIERLSSYLDQLEAEAAPARVPEASAMDTPVPSVAAITAAVEHVTPSTEAMGQETTAGIDEADEPAPQFATVSARPIREIRQIPPRPVVQRWPFGAEQDIATIVLPILVLLAIIAAVTQLVPGGDNNNNSLSGESSVVPTTAAASTAPRQGTRSVASPLASSAPSVTVTSSAIRPTLAPAGSTLTIMSASEAPSISTSATASAPAPSATTSEPTTVPPPTSISSTTPAATSVSELTPAPPTATLTTPEQPGVAGPLVPGGVGTTRAMVEQAFGPAEGVTADGEATYQDGSQAVLYSSGNLAIRVRFDLTVDNLQFGPAEAEGLANYYRPPDARLLRSETPRPGVSLTVYTSPTLTSAFAGQDTNGRDPAIYMEELRFDTATGLVKTIVMAIGQVP